MSGETRLWARMREGVKPFAFVQRIENAVGEGVTDVILHSRNTGECFFVELKYRSELPAMVTTPVFKGEYGLRPAQVAWIYGRAIAGAQIWVLGQCGEHLILIHGRYARNLDTMTFSDLMTLASWDGSARKTDWVSMLTNMQGLNSI